MEHYWLDNNINVALINNKQIFNKYLFSTTVLVLLHIIPHLHKLVLVLNDKEILTHVHVW